MSGRLIVRKSPSNRFNKSSKKQSDRHSQTNLREEFHVEELNVEQEEFQEEEEPEEEGEGEDEREIDEEERRGGAQNVGKGNNSACHVSWKVSDPDILDCPVCCEPLNIPVFQCENGHIACETCCSGTDKCPYCFSTIGYDRCRALEKVLESVRVKCQNVGYGCEETLTFSQKRDHEKACHHAPCTCPLPECNFVGTSRKLYNHFRFRHENAAVKFKYNRIILISLHVKRKFVVLQEETYGDIFVLNNRIERNLHEISICHIAPTWETEIFYSIKTRSGGSILRLQSHTKSLQKPVDNPPSMEELLVIPSKYFGYYRLLKLDIYIRR